MSTTTDWNTLRPKLEIHEIHRYGDVITVSGRVKDEDADALQALPRVTLLRLDQHDDAAGTSRFSLAFKHPALTREAWLAAWPEPWRRDEVVAWLEACPPGAAVECAFTPKGEQHCRFEVASRGNDETWRLRDATLNTAELIARWGDPSTIRPQLSTTDLRWRVGQAGPQPDLLAGLPGVAMVLDMAVSTLAGGTAYDHGTVMQCVMGTRDWVFLRAGILDEDQPPQQPVVDNALGSLAEIMKETDGYKRYMGERVAIITPRHLLLIGPTGAPITEDVLTHNARLLGWEHGALGGCTDGMERYGIAAGGATDEATYQARLKGYFNQSKHKPEPQITFRVATAYRDGLKKGKEGRTEAFQATRVAKVGEAAQ